MDKLSVRSRKNTSGRSGFRSSCAASTADHFVHIRSTGNETTGLCKAPVLKVTTKCVCGKCNNNWLSEFENDVIKPIASPLILAELRSVEPRMTLLTSPHVLVTGGANRNPCSRVSSTMPTIEPSNRGVQRLAPVDPRATHPDLSESCYLRSLLPPCSAPPR